MKAINGVLRRLRASAALLVLVNNASDAQSFNSGSNGSDGALTLTTAGTYVFDPFDTATFGRVLDPDGDGVYHFTSITIGAGVTVKLTASKVNRPVYWLAQQAVQIQGTIDLNGQDFTKSTTNINLRRMTAIPGSGGYAGGAGGSADIPSQPGEGPGGGATQVSDPSSPQIFLGAGGKFTGNRFLIPLVGGSGGGGARATSSAVIQAGGAAGGGALMIASSVSITVTGAITANGGTSATIFGTPQASGAGAGGAIRLVAPTISGNGRLVAAQGSCACGPGVQSASDGAIRLEAFQQQFTGVQSPAPSFGTPFDPLLPAASVRVTKVDGKPLPQNPSGSFTLPDVTINKNEPVLVEIQASGVPLGTVVKLQIISENPIDPLTVFLTADSTPLAGTIESSTATVSFTFPFGFSRGFLRASWTQ